MSKARTAPRSASGRPNALTVAFLRLLILADAARVAADQCERAASAAQRRLDPGSRAREKAENIEWYSISLDHALTDGLSILWQWTPPALMPWDDMEHWRALYDRATAEARRLASEAG